MKHLANFTLHDQSAYIGEWEKFGFEIDPRPRAPLIAFESGEWTEKQILSTVRNELFTLKREGFDAILIGGLSNAMSYAWYLADTMGLEVVISRTPRERTSDGKFIFRLTGCSVLLKPSEILPAPQGTGKPNNE